MQETNYVAQLNNSSQSCCIILKLSNIPIIRHGDTTVKWYTVYKKMQENFSRNRFSCTKHANSDVLIYVWDQRFKCFHDFWPTGI